MYQLSLSGFSQSWKLESNDDVEAFRSQTVFCNLPCLLRHTTPCNQIPLAASLAHSLVSLRGLCPPGGTAGSQTRTLLSSSRKAAALHILRALRMKPQACSLGTDGRWVPSARSRRLQRFARGRSLLVCEESSPLLLMNLTLTGVCRIVGSLGAHANESPAHGF